MEIRCHNCGTKLSVPAGQPREIKCPKCGAMMMVPVGATPPEPGGEVRGHRSHASLKRVYEPIPRSLVYLAGAALAVLLTSPFWVYLIKDRFFRRPLIISDDVADIQVPALTNEPSPVPAMTDPQGGALSFDRFHGVRLEIGREDLQRRYNLRLQNTRGMEPEIYEVERAADIEQMTAYFYGNVLKEFAFVLRERRVGPDEAQAQLVEQFGEPHQQQESSNTGPAFGAGLPRLTAGNVSGDLPRKLAGYTHRRDLTWADQQNRVDATIFHSADGPTVSMLLVRVTAAGWLKAKHPLVGTFTQSATNLLEQPVLPAPATHTPQRVFP